MGRNGFKRFSALALTTSSGNRDQWRRVASYRSFWTPQPDLKTGAAAWIMAGGAHHTAFSYDLTVEQMADWADAMGIESVIIDENTTLRNLKNELRWNQMFYR